VADTTSSSIISRASSVTHEHILAVLLTEIAARGAVNGRLRILDAGCGNGGLLEYLATNLPVVHPELRIELHGYDVGDHGVQTAPDYFAATVARLTDRVPGTPWAERLHLISQGDEWPFPAGYFDAVVSNQVLEHVHDHEAFLGQLARVLRTGGFSAHLFPLRHYIYESHLNLPLVHRVRNHDLLVRYIATLSRLGMGKYPAERRASGMPLSVYAERHADYIVHFTHYRSYGEFLELAKRRHLRASYRYTQEFYSSKLARLLGRPPRATYRHRRSALVDWLCVTVLRYVSGVTLFIEKRESYTERPPRS